MHIRTINKIAFSVFSVLGSSVIAQENGSALDRSNPFYKYSIEIPKEQMKQTDAPVMLEFYANEAGDIGSVQFNSDPGAVEGQLFNPNTLATCVPRKVCVTPSGPCGWVCSGGPIAPDGMPAYLTSISPIPDNNGGLGFSVGMLPLQPDLPVVQFNISPGGVVE